MGLRKAVAGAVLLILLSHAAMAYQGRTDELMWKCEGRDGDLGVLFCVAYLDGIIDAATIAHIRHPQALPICVPEKGISLDQARLIFLKWTKDHPDQLHTTARLTAVIALAQAFPCKN